MHWLDKHARLRKQLSPYLDGGLSAGERTGLEAHLATCQACRAELEELRSTVAAMRDLPQVEAPRSYALTPAMLERRRATLPASSAPPLAFGMRLASAGVAVVLAVVVIGDLSDAGDGGGGARKAADELGASRMTAELAAEADLEQADGEAAAPAPDVTSSAEGFEAPPPEEDTPSTGQFGITACPPVAVAVPTSGATDAAGAGGPNSGDEGAGAGGGGAGGAGATAAATPTPQPAATPTPELRAETGVGCKEQPLAGAVAPTTSAPAPESARDGAEEGLPAQGGLEAEDDGGVSTLRVLEIALAGALIALLAGVGVELALRRRRTA